MPLHDWTRVDAGIFHDFHTVWIGNLRTRLNSGLLPADYYALAEQIAGGLGPDVLTPPKEMLMGPLEPRKRSTLASSGKSSFVTPAITGSSRSSKSCRPATKGAGTRSIRFLRSRWRRWTRGSTSC